MKQEDRTIAETQEELEHTLNTLFSHLLEEPYCDWNEAHAKVLWHISRVITNEHNFMLMKPIEMEEVEAIVKNMADEKALGPDVFTTNLFHAC